MADVTRLLIHVDLCDSADRGPDAHGMDVDVVLKAVLTDGRHILLLERGWSAQQGWDWDEGTPEEERRRVEAEAPGIWSRQTVEEIEDTSRPVVLDTADWEMVAADLRGQGIEIDAEALEALPHDVELSDRVLARIGRGSR